MSAKDEAGERRGLLPRYTLKDHNTFLLADALGDIHDSGDGFFSNDTRMLSQLELAIADRKPSVLGAAISQDNTLFTAHLTNRPLAALGERAIPKGVIHIERSRYLWDSRVYERLRLTNFSEEDAQLPLQLSFGADFADIFEIQGHERKQRGRLLPAEVQEQEVILAYEGLDQVRRCTHLQLSGQPQTVSAERSVWCVSLRRAEAIELFIEIGTEPGPAPSAERFEAGLGRLAARRRRELDAGATVSSSGHLFNEWLDRSRADLALLTTQLPTGPYPYAGIPWFATQFGRDAIIASLQSLWIQPSLAAGVLRFQAATQAQEASAFRDSEPGKIVHEMRRGEMAALDEVPFRCYYGSVDTTPLFVLLAGEYERCTGDRELIAEIWPALLRAIGWIEHRLKRSPTGFLDYARGADSGLSNQAWKDSQDSIFYADGRFPTGPVAVVEVQGYAVAAFEAMAQLAALREDAEASSAWRAQAHALAAAIERHFWLPELEFYAIALDGDGRPCAVPASNAGHLLYCGVPSEARAQKVAEQLCSESFDSGWGIRTLPQ
ncbi:MAG: hypothetical protein JOZ93_05740, partial [Sinobacteraceae bacterium]|nr:hypothetical protein [Nevskiaceae bacterium]